MEIEVDQIVLPAPDRSEQPNFGRGMALPTAQDLEVIESFRLVHFKEGHRVRNGALELLDMLKGSKATRDSFLIIAFWKVIQLEVKLTKNPSCKSNCPWLRSLMEITVWIFSERDESTSAT